MLEQRQMVDRGPSMQPKAKNNGETRDIDYLQLP